MLRSVYTLTTQRLSEAPSLPTAIKSSSSHQTSLLCLCTAGSRACLVLFSLLHINHTPKSKGHAHWMHIVVFMSSVTFRSYVIFLLSFPSIANHNLPKAVSCKQNYCKCVCVPQLFMPLVDHQRVHSSTQLNHYSLFLKFKES